MPDQTLNTELATVEQEIQRLETIRDYLQARLKTGSNGRVRRGPRPRAAITAAAAAQQALEKAGGPMRTKDLLLEVQQAGARMANSEGLYKTLARNPRFVKAGRGVWTLAG